MNCDCVFVDLSDVDIGSVKTRKTREKEAVVLLTCCECQKTIQIGETFRYEKTTLFNGCSFKRSTCMDCISIRDTFFCEGWFYGEMYSHLEEHIRNTNCELAEDCVSVLTPKAREVVCNMIEKCWNSWVCI